MRQFARNIARLGFLFGAPAICCCQAAIPLQDVGGQGSPMRVSGQVSFQDDPSASSRYTYRIEGSIANLSDKAVVLTVIHYEVRGVGTLGLDINLHSDDHFFHPKDLQPGEEERITTQSLLFNTPEIQKHEITGGGDWQTVSADVESGRTPAATAKVVFVQYADGSTWGESDVGRTVMAGRSGILHELIWYDRVLSEKGRSAFLHAFARRDTYGYFPLVTDLVARCENQPESCLVDGMHSMSLAAYRHQDEMKKH
jgi:hypothetical protein